MSLYNMLFGVNQAAPVLLAALGMTTGDVPRFRDCYVDGERIAIYTRTGGGNREHYEEENDAMCANANYIEDEDDDFDNTYATFYFKFPEQYADDLKAISATTGEAYTPSEKWTDMLAALSTKPASAA